MTEAEWLVSEDPVAMYRDIATRLWSGQYPRERHLRRRLDLLCAALGRLLWDWVADEPTKEAFVWLESHAGSRLDYKYGTKEWQIKNNHAQAVKDGKDSGHGVRGTVKWLLHEFWFYDFGGSLRVLQSLPPSPLEGADMLPRDLFPRASVILRDIFGNLFLPTTFFPEWRTDTAVALAAQMYESRDFSAMPILADALQDAGCDSADILTHCRDPYATHVRGCWVVDLVLGKE